MRTAFVASLVIALAPSAARAQPRPVAISAVEHALGASPVHRVAGHGRLTVGVARDGDLAVLTWPSPSCCDQLTHLASNDLDARDRPRVAVREGFGAALGLAVRTAAGERVAWLHDPGAFRVVSSGYRDADGATPVGVYEHTATGLRVEVTDSVHPTDDVLQRRVRVTAPEAVTAVALMAHANLGPTQNVVSRLPLGDVLVDTRNDFGLLWDDARGAFVHFRPSSADPVRDIPAVLVPPTFGPTYFGPLEALMRSPGDVRAEAGALVERLDTVYGRGVYVYFGADPRPGAFQAGQEDDGACLALDRLIDNIVALQGAGIALAINPGVARVFRCPDALRGDAVPRARGWTRVAPMAWQDAQDGSLSNNPASAWRSDAALRVPVTLTRGEGSARVLLAFGATSAEARARFTRARTSTADALEQADGDAWRARAMATRFATAPARIPAADRARIDLAARRAMLHVYNGTDAATGMIVASIARQAPYGLDWPRDGAFFDYALDVAGNHAATTRRLAWALPLARGASVLPSQIFSLTDPQPPLDPRTGTRQYPEAAWEMNYYDTGEMGGFFRFEIDNTAWMIWSAAAHVNFVPAPERQALAGRYWETVRRSAELLAAWRDGRTGLQAPANEDDNAEFTASLHGATAVFAALEASARLARFTGHTAEAVRWERRAAELRDAAVRRFYDPTRMRFVNEVTGAAASNPGSSSLGVTAWLVWPARMLPYTDPRVARQVRYDLEQVLAALRGDGDSPGAAYLTKTTLSAAAFLAGGGDPSVAPLLDEAVVRLARDVIDPDTQTMGEVFVNVRDAQGRVVRRENRVSIPHLWEATLFALTVAAMHDPRAFDVNLSALPPAETPAPGVVPFVPEVPDGGAPDDAPAVDAGMDAGPSPVTTGGGCGCATSSPTSSPAWLWALVALGAARRRRVSAPPSR